MHVLSFNTDGTATTLHTDALPLAQLGRLTIERASTVEFDNGRQSWGVTWTGEDSPAYWASTHADALAWEKKQLNERLLRQ